MTEDLTAPTEQEIANWSGSVLRLVILMTHYRQPLNFTQQKVSEANNIFAKWMKAAIPNSDTPPKDFLEALCNDLNTPKAIALMHTYAKNDGKKLFASMKFLGLI